MRGAVYDPLRRVASDFTAAARLVWDASPGQLTLMLALSAAAAVVPAATLWLAKLLVDEVARAVTTARDADASYGRLARLLAAQVAVGAAGSGLTACLVAIKELLSDMVHNRTAFLVLQKAASLDPARFEVPETYDALRNAYENVGARPLALVQQVVGTLQAIVVLASIGALMQRVGGPVLTLVLLAGVPGVVVSSRFGIAGYWMMRRRTTDARIQTYLGSLLTSEVVVKEVRVFGCERYFLDRWKTYSRRFRTQLVRFVRSRACWSLGGSLASAVLVALATLSVLRLAAARSISVGDFSLFVLGIGQTQSQVAALLSNLAAFHEHLLYMRNLFDFLDLPGTADAGNADWRGPIDSIEFERVTFRYPSSVHDVVHDVSFIIRRNSMLALVGPNGAGKTTLVKLLAGLYEPTRGRILLNGLDASRFTRRSVQRELSVLFQDYGQYYMSVAENIGLSDVAAMGDAAAIEMAGRRAGVDAVIRRLPERYETMLGQLFGDGRQLSGGQWQRLALARMFFRPASVVILDEPTGALDGAAEAEVANALRTHRKGRIVVVASHRVSTVRLADRVMMIDRGQVRADGTHQQLSATSEAYAQLFALHPAVCD
jgi:ATP-binding cassette, subfamily B, bacterial